MINRGAQIFNKGRRLLTLIRTWGPWIGGVLANPLTPWIALGLGVLIFIVILVSFILMVVTAHDFPPPTPTPSAGGGGSTDVGTYARLLAEAIINSSCYYSTNNIYGAYAVVSKGGA